MGNSNIRNAINKDLVAWLSLIIAGFAVLLSQFKPIYTYFEKADILVTIGDRVEVTHNLGLLYFTTDIAFQNRGPVSGDVKTINIFITDGNDFSKVMKCRYFESPGGQFTFYSGMPRIRFSTLPLEPGSPTQTRFQFYEELPDDREARLQDVFVQASNQLGQFNPNVTQRREVSNELFAEMTELSEIGLGSFTAPSDYDIMFVFENGEGKVIDRALFKMSVRQNQIDLLAGITENYKYGERLVRPSTQGGGFYAELDTVESPSRLKAAYRSYEAALTQLDAN